MTATTYELEWQRQLSRSDIPEKHLPVHRWYLRLEQPFEIPAPIAPRGDLTIIRAKDPTVDFYRFLYHTAGEEYLWGDRRRMSDADLTSVISPNTIHLMILYVAGTPAGFFELDFSYQDRSNLKYFALLPTFKGGGLGSYMLNSCIHYAGQQRALPLSVDTCTLDHPIALENYKKRGFVDWYEEDEEYPDPRLDGTVPGDAGAHVPKIQYGV